MTTTSKKQPGEKIKMGLSFEIHSANLFLPDPCEIFIEVIRGKDLKKSTEKHEYNPSISLLPLNSKFSANITLEKKGKKFAKKTLKFKIFQSLPLLQLGSLSIDLSPVPSLKKPISNREISFKTSSEQVSSLVISLSLTPILGKSEPESNSAVKDVQKIEFAEDVDSDNESVSSRMSFSDAILHPRDSEIMSESSSSEEEYKQLPVDKLIASAPKASMDNVTPNERSKHLSIAEKEEKAGIATKRDTGNCVNCTVV